VKSIADDERLVFFTKSWDTLLLTFLVAYHRKHF
jgi:hypothetical protein